MRKGGAGRRSGSRGRSRCKSGFGWIEDLARRRCCCRNEYMHVYTTCINSSPVFIPWKFFGSDQGWIAMILMNNEYPFCSRRRLRNFRLGATPRWGRVVCRFRHAKTKNIPDREQGKKDWWPYVMLQNIRITKKQYVQFVGWLVSWLAGPGRWRLPRSRGSLDSKDTPKSMVLVGTLCL